MKERGIIFNAEMVRAVLDGRKTQTRRACKPYLQDYDSVSKSHFKQDFDFYNSRSVGQIVDSPYGKKGDRLYVKEEYRGYEGSEEFMMLQYRADGAVGETPKYMDEKQCLQFPDAHIELDGGACVSEWKRARFMPRWASRINLEITDIRVERLWAISERDSVAEGCFGQGKVFPSDEYRILWDSINKKRGFGWDVNPYVWCVEFKLTNQSTK